jgi:putative SOS response-associated peptidase YedK
VRRQAIAQIQPCEVLACAHQRGFILLKTGSRGAWLDASNRQQRLLLLPVVVLLKYETQRPIVVIEVDIKRDLLLSLNDFSLLHVGAWQL